MSSSDLLSPSATTVNDRSRMLNNANDDHWSISRISIAIFLFIASGLLEIGGGWLIWIFVRGRDGWPKDGHTWWVCIIGCMMLVGYGFVPTLQPIEDFGRVYAAYGGIFIAMSFIWAYFLDGFVPDKGDIIGASVALVGVCIVLFWPRVAS